MLAQIPMAQPLRRILAEIGERLSAARLRLAITLTRGIPTFLAPLDMYNTLPPIPPTARLWHHVHSCSAFPIGVSIAYAVRQGVSIEHEPAA